MSKHMAVWLDHLEARLFAIDPDTATEKTVLAPAHNFHHRASNGQRHLKEHPEDAKHYFHDVVTALNDAAEVLIVGPGTAKLDLHRYIHKMDPALEKKVVAMETVDHPTDAQIVAYAKTYFKQHANAS